MQALLKRQFTDEELDTFDFCGKDEPEDYLDYIRESRVIYACTADELRTLLRTRLVSNKANETSSEVKAMRTAAQVAVA